MKRHIRITFNSPVILTYGALCVLTLLVGQATGGYTTSLLFMTYRASLKDPFTYLRFFTHILGHSGWDHLIGNMTYLLLLGPMLEEKYGSKMILQIMAVVAFVTGLFNFIVFPGTALLGASGVCFAFILLSSFTSMGDGEIPITFIVVAVFFLGQQIYDGIFVQDNVANFAHIIGGIVGAAAGFAAIRRRGHAPAKKRPPKRKE